MAESPSNVHAAGIPAFSINSIIFFSAPEMITPCPTSKKGFFALLMASAAASICHHRYGLRWHIASNFCAFFVFKIDFGKLYIFGNIDQNRTGTTGTLQCGRLWQSPKEFLRHW
jgi:hypothetical protein